MALKGLTGIVGVEAPGRVELPTNGLGNRCSIHLSYGATRRNLIMAHQFTHSRCFPGAESISLPWYATLSTKSGTRWRSRSFKWGSARLAIAAQKSSFKRRD